MCGLSVDGTLIEAWASTKSFRPKGGGPKGGGPKGDDGDDAPPGRNAERNFHGEKRSNEIHRITSVVPPVA